MLDSSFRTFRIYLAMGCYYYRQKGGKKLDESFFFFFYIEISFTPRVIIKSSVTKFLYVSGFRAKLYLKKIGFFFITLKSIWWGLKGYFFFFFFCCNEEMAPLGKRVRMKYFFSSLSQNNYTKLLSRENSSFDKYRRQPRGILSWF